MTEPLDSGDLDALLEMERSLGYRLLIGRIEEEIERKRNTLEQHCDPEITATTRGEIAALRMVLTVPENLKAEIAAKPRYIRGKR